MMKFLTIFDHEPCGFTDGPLEIRLHIYQDAIEASIDLRFDSAGKRWYGKTWCYNLASTCRQVRHEFLPLILRERMWIKENEGFLDWAKRGSPLMREMTPHLSLSFTHVCYQVIEKLPTCPADSCDVPPELKILLDGRKEQSLTPSSHNEEGSQRALKMVISIWDALHYFPNVQRIWLNTGDLEDYSTNQPALSYKPQADLIMEMSSHAFPGILTYVNCSDWLPLSHLKRFRGLQRLHFSGYSKTSSAETLDILQSLTHLESIIIEQFIYMPRRSLPHSPNFGAHNFQDLVITPDIVAQMNPLKDVTITSHSDFRATMWHVVPLTRPLMNALLAHSQSLQSLKITQRYPHPHLERDVLEILDFAHCSPIPHVYLYLKLPPSLGHSMDPKHFLPRTSRKRMDILFHNCVLEVRTGKYFPSARELKWRKKTNAMKKDSNTPKSELRQCMLESMNLDSNMEHSSSIFW
jgi:hypothetical protein